MAVRAYRGLSPDYTPDLLQILYLLSRMAVAWRCSVIVSACNNIDRTHSSGGAAIRYILPVLWMTLYSRIMDHMKACRYRLPTVAAKVTPLRRYAQTNVSAASYWLHRVLTTAGAETRRVHRERDAGGGACNISLSRQSLRDKHTIGLYRSDICWQPHQMAQQRQVFNYPMAGTLL